MRNKKLFKSVVMVSAAMLMLGGCGNKKVESVISESVESATDTSVQEESIERVEDTSTEETIQEESIESMEDVSTEETIQEESIERVEDTSTEEVNQEEDRTGLEYEVVSTSDTTLYVIQKANVRSGPGTEYEVVSTLGYGDKITSNGKVVDGENKVWFVIKTDANVTQMINGNLVSYENPNQVVKQQTQQQQVQQQQTQQQQTQQEVVEQPVQQTQQSNEVVHDGSVDADTIHDGDVVCGMKFEEPPSMEERMKGLEDWQNSGITVQ